MGPAIGFGILGAILGFLWILNSAADEALKQENNNKGDDKTIECRSI